MKTRLVNKEIQQDYVRELLRERGVDNPEAILNPTCGLQDPFDFEGMAAAVDALDKVLTSNNAPQIGMIVDSDCDGFTSSAILYLYLRRIAPDCKITYYMHDGKGHGFSDLWPRIEENRDKFDLFVVADAATNDEKYIKQLNCTTIVLD